MEDSSSDEEDEAEEEEEAVVQLHVRQRKPSTMKGSIKKEKYSEQVITDNCVSGQLQQKSDFCFLNGYLWRKDPVCHI